MPAMSSYRQTRASRARVSATPLQLALTVATLTVACMLAATSVAAAGTCYTFQSRNTPAAFPGMYRCNHPNYVASSCCSSASAKRAYNWVYEDDGCGVVGYACARKLADLACATNCADNLIVTGVNYNNSRPVLPGKVVISATFATELYDACKPYGWCGTQQQQTSSCSFLSVTVTKRGNSGSTTTVQTLQQSDTVSRSQTSDATWPRQQHCQCTWVTELDAVSFAENILGVIVHPNDDARFATTPLSVAYVPAGAAFATHGVAWLITLAAIVVSIVMMTASGL